MIDNGLIMAEGGLLDCLRSTELALDRYIFALGNRAVEELKDKDKNIEESEVKEIVKRELERLRLKTISKEGGWLYSHGLNRLLKEIEEDYLICSGDFYSRPFRGDSNTGKIFIDWGWLSTQAERLFGEMGW